MNEKISQQPWDGLIAPGQKWRLIDESPWPNPHVPVIVTDVLGGWVRYDMAYAKDQRRTVTEFVTLYEIAEVTA